MKGEDKKTIFKAFIFTFVLAVLSNICITAKADGDAFIIETCTNESDFSIYIKNAGDSLSDATVQIGTSQGTQTICETISDTEFETLILIDNSLSIPKDDRNKIAEFLDYFFQVKGENEKIAIGVFSREITYLTNFTSDYNTLQDTVNAISYQNQDTYITDMLYELWASDYLSNPTNVYRRIIIIADGIDDESIGYTTNELNQLIKENTYPIYTIGSKTEKNNTELENLFALSRLSNAEYFMLDSVDNVSLIADKLAEDKSIVKVTTVPPAELMDGSKKVVKITFAGQSVSADIRMPQQIEEHETQSEEIIEEISQEIVVEETVEEETTVETSQDSQDLQKAAAKKFIMLVSIAWVFIIAIIVIFIIVQRNKKKRNQEISEVESLKAQREKELVDALADNPQIEQQTEAYIVLTDVNEPEKSFKAIFNHNIIIGRSAADCQIVLEYDKSVSGRHCEIFKHENQILVRDLKSTNGTFVNGNRIETDTKLASGSIIVLGSLAMRFDYHK